ncbi:MAG: dTMP kinase [Pseudomonadota bacterium]|nr:dTMP kinase [Pseudomonadota bacterium]
MAAGRFITLEGGEGAGKSTQVAALAEALRERGHEVVTTREPGGSDGAEEIRRLLVSGPTDRWDPLSEVLLLYAARRDHWQHLIAPALARGAWVISDRFADSTMAYQGYGLGLARESIRRIHRVTLEGVAPDLTLVLDLPVLTGIERSLRRLEQTAGIAEDRYEQMDIDFHERMRAGFLEIAAGDLRRCQVIDANCASADVSGAILAAVDARLKDAA